jgi:ribosomal protein S3
MSKRVEGIRICCFNRLGGAEIARTECGKHGKTSCNPADGTGISQVLNNGNPMLTTQESI